MNRKFKLKRIKRGIFLILACYVASSLTFNIYAQTIKVKNGSGASSEQTTCEHKTCTKANIKTIYNPSITNDYNETTKQEIITVKINKTDKAAKFYYVIADITKTGYVILKEGYLTNTDNKVDYPLSTTREYNIEVIIALEESSECATTSKFEVYPHDSIYKAITKHLDSLKSKIPKVEKIDDKKCRYALFATSSIHIDYAEDTKEENLSLIPGGLCHSFRNGLCDNFNTIEGVDEAGATSLKARCEKYNPKTALTPPSGYSSLDSYYANVLDYCYSNMVDVNYSDKNVSTMINNAVLSYIADSSEHSSVELTPPAVDSVNKSDPKAKIALKCDKDKVSDTYANTGEHYQYTNINKYHHTDVKTTTETSTTGKQYTCEKTCQEEITVQYGPPVAVKAGLCFEYQVKVESKVNCKSKFIGTKPNKNDYNYCTPTPRCNESTNFFDQAGPNEDFDACINKCDGGKYSQACIDSCYNKVYNSDSKYLGVNYNNQVKAKQISNNMLTNKAYYTNEADIKQLMKTVANNSNCYYKKDASGIINWVCNSTPQGWENYGRYYFQTLAKAKQTLRDDIDIGPGEPRYNDIWHYKGIDGYKKACWNSTCSSYCGQECRWTGCGSAKYLNPTDAINDYNADMSAYNNAKTSCTTSVSCNTETTTFTIKVDNEGSSFDPDDLEFGATVTNKAWTDSNNIIIDKGQCYKDDSDTKRYMTEWGVPGTSINNKTGAISYKKKAPNSGWSYKENQFCTSLESKNVNEDWWKWRVNKIEGSAPNPTKDDNITASTKDFGYFDWNFEIKCFYASFDEPDPDDPGPDPDPKPLSYRVRSVDNENLFPNPDADATELLDKALFGRTPGFNWSFEATDTRNPNYEITPTTLMKEIQTLGTNIYNGDSYLDYEFLLEPETLKMIANHKTNFNDFSSGDTKTQHNIVYYKSRLINEIIAATNKKLPPASTFGCNNKATSGGCQNFS